jgi:hypothetical protein
MRAVLELTTIDAPAERLHALLIDALPHLLVGYISAQLEKKLGNDEARPSPASLIELLFGEMLRTGQSLGACGIPIAYPADFGAWNTAQTFDIPGAELASADNR